MTNHLRHGIAQTTATEIADKLATEHNLTKGQGKALVDGVFRAIAEAAAGGEEISLPGSGKFKSRPRRNARAGILPPALP